VWSVSNSFALLILKGRTITTPHSSGRPLASVSVIIVGYNSEAALAKYLPGFVGSLPEGFEIILVDNNSNDRTIDVFHRICPDGRVLETGDNLGFAKAVNIGADQATGDWILLLNPDAAVSAFEVQALQQSVDSQSACAAVGPIVNSGGNVIPAGRFPTIWRMILHSTALSALGRVSGIFEGPYIRVGEIRRGLRGVDWITGGCMLLRRQAWIEVGGFSERWFMYGEDVDFCFRLKRHGYEILLNQDLVISHEIGQSSTGVDGKISGVWLENLYDFYSSAIATTSFERFVWKAIVWAGFAIRAELFSLLSRTRGDKDYAFEAKRFRIYASIIRPSHLDLRA